MPLNCFGWDILNELNVHEPINDAAVSYFLRNFSSEKTLDEQGNYQGIAWHSGSEVNIILNNSGVTRTETFRNWVKIGGVDADVESEDAERIILRDIHTNEITQIIIIGKPLRHFYDPIFEKKWLTDFSDVTNLQFTNPEIDHIQWAIYNKEHHWSFNQGLLLYKAAMENTKTNNLPQDIANFNGYFAQEGNLRNNLFSASFRALGETMHGIADLCVPAHVRNDSHPGFPFVGGTDPIEKYTNYSIAKKILTESFELPSVNFLNKKNSVEDLMIGCAAFTNANFFSRDTICNDSPKVVPDTFNKNCYPNPRFSDTELLKLGDDTSVFEVSRTFSKKIVLVRKTITSYVFAKTESYEIPNSAAEGQAGVLLPLAAAAGGEIIDRFFPTMKLTLEAAKDGDSSFKLTGSLIHEIDKDPTWKEIGAIKYNGTGTVLVNGSATAVVNFVDGIMTPLANRTFKENDKVQLTIKAGALVHTSNIFTVKDEVVSLPKTLVCQQLPEFSYVVSAIGNEDSRRVCYFTTPLPATIATVLTSNVDFIVYNWWCDNANGTAITELYDDRLPNLNVFPYEDLSVVAQYGSAAKELPCVERLKGRKICVPAGNHVLHMVGYFGGTNPAAALIGKPGNYESINKDFLFSVAQPESPITVYKNGEPSEVISFASGDITHEELSNGPDWAPTTWGRGVVRLSGAYNYFPDYAKNPKIMIKGSYNNGLRNGKWLIVTEKETLELDYDISGTMTGAKVYDISKSLIRKYSSVLDIQPAFDVVNYDKSLTLAVKIAQVETFGEISERYNLINGIKEGNYQSAGPDGQTVYGQYSGGQRTGTWSFYDPAKNPSDWVVQY